MTEDEVLMMMEMTARAERKQGFTGYNKPPKELHDICRRLVKQGLAEEQLFNVGWFRPTAEGAQKVGHRIQRAQ